MIKLLFYPGNYSSHSDPNDFNLSATVAQSLSRLLGILTLITWLRSTNQMLHGPRRAEFVFVRGETEQLEF